VPPGALHFKRAARTDRRFLQPDRAVLHGTTRQRVPVTERQLRAIVCVFNGKGRRDSLGFQGEWRMLDGLAALPKPQTNMKIQDIMTPDPYVCDPETPVSEVAAKMRDLEVGMIPVCDGKKLRGTVTDRDIVLRAVADELDPTMTVADEVMSSEIISCFEDEEVGRAAELMERNQIRRLPVLNRSKQLVGIISLGDIAAKGKNDRITGETLDAISHPPTSESHIEDDDKDDELSVGVIDPALRSESFPH
jgi:CBS domain-containing protein